MSAKAEPQPIKQPDSTVCLEAQPPARGRPASLHSSMRKQIDHHHPRQDQADADDRRGIQALLEVEGADQGEEDDADAGPDGVDDADGDAAQGEGEQVEGDGVADDHHHRGQELGEALGGLEGAGADHLGDDGDAQVEPVHGGLHGVQSPLRAR